MKQDIVLTGDRPTGPLHLGHYVGSLLQRVSLQNKYKQYVMIADVQALTDNADNPQKVRDNVLELALDYLSVGIDPTKTTIFIQSLVPAIAELTIFFMNFVTLNRLQRNPTIKTEIAHRAFGDSVTAGFLTYPISQAADITVVKGTLVPVGEDQLPIIEQANEIIRAFNRTYNTDIFGEITPLISAVPRLVGIDGKAKMSKSLNNAIFLSDSADQVAKKVMLMYTDPDHIHVHDPGKVEGNAVFSYLDVFDPHKDEVAQLKEHYKRGGLGDVVLKKRLITILNDRLAPIRAQREQYARDKAAVMKMVLDGTSNVVEQAHQTMSEVRKAMKIDYRADSY
jgi:tryptophanyl-tRNA synthetase